MPVSRNNILKLYKSLIREGSKFPSYNYRMYTLRRVRDAFNESKTLTDSAKIEEFYSEGLNNLEVIKRQNGNANFMQVDFMNLGKFSRKRSVEEKIANNKWVNVFTCYFCGNFFCLAVVTDNLSFCLAVVRDGLSTTFLTYQSAFENALFSPARAGLGKRWTMREVGKRRK